MWDNDVVPYLVLEYVPGRLLGTTASIALNLVLASYLSMLVTSGVAGADAVSGETWDFSTSCQDRKRAFPSFPIAQSTGAFSSLPRTGALPRGSFIFLAARPTNHRDGGAGLDVTASPMTTPLDLYPHCPSTPPSWWCPIPVVNPDSQIIAASFTSIDFLRPHT